MRWNGICAFSEILLDQASTREYEPRITSEENVESAKSLLAFLPFILGDRMQNMDRFKTQQI